MTSRYTHAPPKKNSRHEQNKYLTDLQKHDLYFKLEYIGHMQITIEEVDLLCTTVTKDKYDKLATELGIAQLLRP